MSGAPFFSPTASSIPYQQDTSRLGVVDLQAAVDKLAWLVSISDLMDEDGNFIIRLGQPVENVVLSSDSSSYLYLVSASDNGELTTDSSVIPAVLPQNYRVFKKPDGTFARISIADDGTVAVFDVPEDPYMQPSNKLFFKSPNSTLWLFGITDSNEIVLESGQIFNNWFKVVNQADQLLFGVNTQGFLGLNYLPVFTKLNLPSSPAQQSNTLPWSFLLEDDGVTKVPIYFDGAVWRYFSNNGLV